MPDARVAATPARGCGRIDIVVTMLPEWPRSRKRHLRYGRTAGGLKRGALLLDTSSFRTLDHAPHGHATAALGVEMVDAPVSGAEAGAKNAELVFMVGGHLAAVARVQPLFAVLGKSQFHLGPIGSGHAMKSINNLITAITFLATAEGLVIGSRYGLDPAASRSTC